MTRNCTLHILESFGLTRILGACYGEANVTATECLLRFLQQHPGSDKNPLFHQVVRDINYWSSGESRKQAFVDAHKTGARASSPTMPPPSHRWWPGPMEKLTDQINTLLGGGAVVNSRNKSADGILQKVDRLVRGDNGRAPRPGYQVGDVIDAIGVCV
jgi:hypothetical protein